MGKTTQTITMSKADLVKEVKSLRARMNASSEKTTYMQVSLNQARETVALHKANFEELESKLHSKYREIDSLKANVDHADSEADHYNKAMREQENKHAESVTELTVELNKKTKELQHKIAECYGIKSALLDVVRELR